MSGTMKQLPPCAHGQTLLDAKVLDAMLEEVSRCVVCPRSKPVEVRP